jgi:Family of unknown function (DUF5681)
MKNAPISTTEDEPMAKPTGDYEIGRGKPPRHAGFQKGLSGNPKGRPKGSKNLATLLSQALDEKVYVTEDGRRRRVTKRELVVKQLVNKSASADLRAIKQLTDIVERVEHRTGASPALPEPPQLTATDREVVELFVARLRRQIAAEAAEAAAATAAEKPD